MLKEWIISASVLTAAVLLMRLIFRRRISQRLQYLLWLPVLVRLLLPVPLFHMRYSVTGAAEQLAPAVFAEVTAAPTVTAAPPPPAATPSAPPVTAGPDTAVKPTPVPGPPAAHTVTPDPAPAPAAPLQLDWGALLARLWLAGSIAMALWLLGVNLRFARSLRRSRRVFREGPLPVYLTGGVASPCLFGLFRPAVYLTAACESLPEEELRQVILHEETHRRQGDHIWGCLRCLALAVWWWNPLVWLAARYSRRDGELCCDEKVMKLLGEAQRLDYGRTLVSLLPEKAPRPLLSAATLSGGGRAMKERLNMIVKQHRRWVLAATLVLLLAVTAAACTFAGKPAETAPPEPTPSYTPTSMLQPAEDYDGLLRDEGVSFTLETAVCSLADIRENAALLARMREAGETISPYRHYLDTACVSMRVVNVTKEKVFLGTPELEAFRDGAWYRLEYEAERRDRLHNTITSGDSDGSIKPNEYAIGTIRLPDMEQGLLAPGQYRVSLPYTLGGTGGAPDHVVQAEFEIAEALAPQPTPETYGLDPDSVEELRYSSPRREYTLHRGDEGFEQVLAFLTSLRGTPAYMPETVNRGSSLTLTDGAASRGLLTLEYDGERVYTSVGNKHYRALEAPGRPDEELEAIFERYAARAYPAPVPFEWDVIEDGTLALTPEKPSYDYEALQAAIALSLRRYTEPHPVGESSTPDEGAVVRLTAENRGEGTLYYEFPFLLAWRGGAWCWVPTRFNMASDLIPRSLEPGEKLETGIIMDVYDDPLGPGLYRACMSFAVDDNYRYTHLTWVEFEITGTSPAPNPTPVPTPEPTPEPTPDPDGKTELLRTKHPEEINELVYLFSWGDRYFLRRGEAGFDEAMEKLLSLRGIPCEAPERRALREIRSDYASPVQLFYDGQYVYGAYPNEYRWLRLDGEGRPDRELAAIFERYGLTAGPVGEAVDYEGMIEDGSVAAATGQPAYDVNPLAAAIAELREAYETTLIRSDERVKIPLSIENRSDVPCIYGDDSLSLEILLDGRWFERRTYADGWFGIEYHLQPWEKITPQISMSGFILPLEAGHYRLAFRYSMEEDVRGYDHVAFAEFDLTDGPPAPAPEPTPAPTFCVPVTVEQGTDWLTLPEGTRWLTEEELAEWQAWFEADWMRPQFLNSAYTKPSDVDLGELFYVGVDVREETREAYVAANPHPIAEEDIRYYLLHLGDWPTECPTDKLPRSEMDALLQKYLGLGLDSTGRIGLSWYYLPETDAYYHTHGDTNMRSVRLLYGTVREKNASEISRRWVDLYYGGGAVWRVRLVVEKDNPHFVSNLRVLSNGTDYICETPQPGISYPADYSGDYGKDVTVLTLTPEVFESYEAARADTDAICSKEVNYHDEENKTETVVDTFHSLWEQECPGYGTLIYGEVDTAHGPLSHLFFITLDGRRYRIEEPQNVFSAYPMTEDWTAAEDGRGYWMMGADPGMLRWWMNCRNPTGIGGGETRQGGAAEWTLYLPTMEVFIIFTPDN